MLKVKNLSVSFGDKKLLSNINLEIPARARTLLTGRNGSGKTTLAQTIAGNPDYKINHGAMEFDGRDITDENVTTRALLGIFLGGQNVPEIPGLSVTSFLKHSAAAHYRFRENKEMPMGWFMEKLEIARERLEIPQEWMGRSVNVGFSGGERKRLMFLRLLMAEPKLAILDEPDSGADATAQKLFAEIINGEAAVTANTGANCAAGISFLIISHQEKFAQLINPTSTLLLKNGRIDG